MKQCSNIGVCSVEVNTITKYIELYRRKGYKDGDIRRKLGKETLVVIRINTTSANIYS